jgi:hypothetical protein
MIVIARIKSVTKHVVGNCDSVNAMMEFDDNNDQEEDPTNPYGLEDNDTYFKCQIEKLEHIVGFEGDDYSFTDYACR